MNRTLLALWVYRAHSGKIRTTGTDPTFCDDAEDLRDFRSLATTLSRDGFGLRFYEIEDTDNGLFYMEDCDLAKLIEKAEEIEREQESEARHDHKAYLQARAAE